MKIKKIVIKLNSSNFIILSETILNFAVTLNFWCFYNYILGIILPILSKINQEINKCPKNTFNFMFHAILVTLK